MSEINDRMAETAAKLADQICGCATREQNRRDVNLIVAALAAEYERGREDGLREARRIAQLMSDNLEEDNPALDHVIAAIDAHLSAKGK